MKFIRLLKGGLSQRELDQIGALPSDKVGKYNLYQGQGEFYITKHKLNDTKALMDTADTFEEIYNKFQVDFEDNPLVIDEELQSDYENYWGTEIELDPDIEDDNLENYGFYNLSKYYAD